MATQPSIFYYTQEVETATIGDQVPTPAAGSLALFMNQNGFAYKKTSASVVSRLVPTAVIPSLVDDYGADNTGTTDIATPVANVVAAGIPDIYVPAGSFKCATAGQMNITTNLRFIGSGRKTTIFKTNHASNTAFQFRNWGGGFENCGFDTLVARTGGYAVDFPSAAQAGAGSGSLYCYMRQCDVYNQFVAIHSGDHVQLFDDIEIRYPTLTLANQGGILFDGAAAANDKRASNLLIQGNNSASQFGIRINQCASLTLTGRNDFINCCNGMDVVPGSGQSVPTIYASNTFFDSGLIGVNMVQSNATGGILRCHFTQCWFSSNTTAGIRLNGSGSANAISGVDLLNCDIYGNAIGVEALAAQDWSVRGSRIAGNTTAGVRVTAATTMNFDVSDNRFGTVASPQFGVNAIGIDVLAGTFNKYVISGNSGLETDTIGIQDNGVIGPTGFKRIADNPGLLCSGFSLPALASAGASLLANNGRGAVTSGTAKTFMMTFRVPARAVLPGTTMRLKVYAVSSSNGVPTWEVAVGTAGTTADTTNLACVQAAQAANVRSAFEAEIQVINLSGANNVVVNGLVMGGITSAGVWVNETVAAEVTASITTTAVWFITLSLTCGTAGTMTVQQATLEVL